jgi:C-terminal processing protease CtpA/Prc
VLIDHNAISQSEATALWLEAAAPVRFFGTVSAGTNGDITSAVLPGGLVLSFTGHDVRHADGRQLQGVGILPDVEVAPTVAGILAGRDEVLERAVDWLREQTGATAAPSPPAD